MRTVSKLPRLWIGALAGAGIAGAHWVAYLVDASHGHTHRQLLESTGHSYWPWFAALAMGALLVALAPTTNARTRNRRDQSEMPLTSLAIVLTVIQTCGFLALEMGERMLLGPRPLASHLGRVSRSVGPSPTDSHCSTSLHSLFDF